MALTVAKDSKCKQKHGALLVKGGCIVALGYNKPRNAHLAITRASIHAEEVAIKKAKNTKGAMLIVVRINSRGMAMSSKPCNQCQELIKSAGIRKVVYT